MKKPTRTWWMKRHDAINSVIIAAVLLLILWTSFFQ